MEEVPIGDKHTMTNYAYDALNAVTTELPNEDPELLRLYALLALTRGTFTTMEDVHDAWSLWRLSTAPEHPSIVRFDKLSRDEQVKDWPYVSAIRRAARNLRARDQQH